MHTDSFGEKTNNHKNLESKSEEYHNLILNGITDVVVLYEVENGSDFRFLKANHNCLKLVGKTENQVIGKLVEDVHPSDLAETFKHNYITCIESKKPMTYEETTPYGIFETRLIPLFDPVGNSTKLIGIHRDITEKKSLENQIARLDRLHVIGEMAAGIAHEVRNPMTTVRGFLQLLAKKEIYAADREYFNLMINELDRANSIIVEYLSLAKNKKIDLQLQNLNNIVYKIVPLLQAGASMADKYVFLELCPIPDFFVDEKEISQLIINLVCNALEVTSTGGSVTIKTSLVDDVVILSVIDQGSGIPLEIIDKLGTPFLTTKEHGTGLGLAICYSIAARHEAAINVSSDGSGTTFSVTFTKI